VPSLLVKDAVIVTQDAERRLLRGDLRAEDGLLAAVGGDLGTDADVVVEADGDILLPGFVNLHTHTPMTVLRGLGDDLLLEEWLRTRIWPAERTLRREDVEAGTELALLEMARTGTTAFNDMYVFADASAEATVRSGLRGFIASTFIDFDTAEHLKEQHLTAARGFIKRWQGHHLVTPVLGPHSTYTLGAQTLDEVRALRDETGCRVHVHCSETRTEVQDVLERRGARPVEVLRRHGLLDDAILAHCGWVTKEEIRVMREHGSHAAHCPVSNMKLATGGVMPLTEMLAEGVNVGLGTDGAASNNTLDILETAKFTALVQKQHRWDARSTPAHTVLDLATLGGARALGLPAQGLVPGAPADFCLVSTQAPHMRPLTDPVSALVYCARGTDVRMTVVAGRIVYLDGAWPTVDADAIFGRAERVAARLADVVRAGLAQDA
jgi:5-methylthioadenosine/S-adenosylhomocysteine deaminase